MAQCDVVKMDRAACHVLFEDAADAGTVVGTKGQQSRPFDSDVGAQLQGSTAQDRNGTLAEGVQGFLGGAEAFKCGAGQYFFQHLGRSGVFDHANGFAFQRIWGSIDGGRWPSAAVFHRRRKSGCK